MAIPTEKEIELPLLYEIEQAGGSVGQNAAKYKELHDKVAAHFPHMTPAERAEKRKGGSNKFDDKVRWSSYSLSYKGELERSPAPPGKWTITEKGKERLKREWTVGSPPTPTKTTPTPTAPTPPLNRHEQLKKVMVEMGQKLGYYPETEWRTKGYPRPHDVVWMKEAVIPEHVIEICDGGSLDTDTVKLNQARTKLPTAKRILVVTDDKNFADAKTRFAGQRGIAVVKAETIEQLNKIVQDNSDLLGVIL